MPLPSYKMKMASRKLATLDCQKFPGWDDGLRCAKRRLNKSHVENRKTRLNLSHK